jgi:predicted ATPase
VSLADRDVSKVHPGWVFFDRGLIDAASGMEELTGKPFLNRLARRHRYHQNVFLTPPWPEIYVRDHERRHDLADGIEEYERLLKVYPALGYALHLLPKVSVMDRVDFVLDVLRTQAPPGPAS